MVRKSVREILAGGIAAAAVLAAAAPAAAKCGHGTGEPCPDPVRLSVTIDGPELAAPMVIRGRDAWRMLYVTGAKYRPYNVLDEVPDSLGSMYEAVYEFRVEGMTLHLRQHLYPYAVGRPFAYTPAGQRLMGESDGGPAHAASGWRGSRTLETILRAHGLPEEAPDASDAGVRAAGTGAGGGGAPPWWVGGILALGALVVVPRLRRRSA